MDVTLYLLIFVFGSMFIIQPFINNQTLFFAQDFRIRILHKVFMGRIWTLSFFEPQTNLSISYRAFEEIIQLHDPPLFLTTKPNRTELIQYRINSKRILKSLYPKRDKQTCIIKPIVFESDGRQVLSYSIKHIDIGDWNETSQDVLLYIHGGGFVSGDIDTYAGYECYLSHVYRVHVIHIEYRLAPENTLLSSISDVVAVYSALLKYDPKIYERMIGMGDSSGGLMWLRLIQLMVEQKQPVPIGLVLLSPWVDLSFLNVESDDETEEKRVLYSLELALNLREQAFHFNESKKGLAYFENFSKEIQKVNPSEHSFEGFPPIYVSVGTEELFSCDASILEERILENNGKITIDKGYGLMHTHPMFHLWSSEAECSQNKIRTFIEEL